MAGQRAVGRYGVWDHRNKISPVFKAPVNAAQAPQHDALVEVLEKVEGDNQIELALCFLKVLEHVLANQFGIHALFGDVEFFAAQVDPNQFFNTVPRQHVEHFSPPAANVKGAAARRRHPGANSPPQLKGAPLQAALVHWNCPGCRTCVVLYNFSCSLIHVSTERAAKRKTRVFCRPFVARKPLSTLPDFPVKGLILLCNDWDTESFNILQSL